MEENFQFAVSPQTQSIESAHTASAMSGKAEQQLVPVKEEEIFVGNDVPWRRHAGITMQLADHASGDQMAISTEKLLTTVQTGVDKVLADARAKKSRGSGVKARVSQHRADFKKRKQARRQVMQEVNANQASEPRIINSFDALPHFEYLEIAEAIDSELPLDLNGFSSLGLSPPEAHEGADVDSLNELLAEPFAEDITFSDDTDITDEYVADAATRMLQQLSLSPVEECSAGCSHSEILNPEHPILDVPESAGETSESSPSLHQVYQSQRCSKELCAPLDNLLCCFFTCPIEETHCEGMFENYDQLVLLTLITT